MRASSRLAGLAACCVMAFTPMTPCIAKARVERADRAYHRPYYQYYAARPAVCPVHKNAYGELIDCRGWRLRDNSLGWDPSCLNLDYLSSQFACSTPNGGH